MINKVSNVLEGKEVHFRNVKPTIECVNVDRINVHTISQEDLTPSEVAVIINNIFDNLDTHLKSIFLDSDFVNETITKIVSKNYNKLSEKERIMIFANLNKYVSSQLGGCISDHINIFSDLNDTLEVYFDQYEEDDYGKCNFYSKIFGYKDSGLLILYQYMSALRRFIPNIILQPVFEGKINYEDLKGNARIYYENLCESVLSYNWSNYKQFKDKEYYNQPLVIDSEVFCNEIIIKIMNKAYKVSNEIDSEMSELLNRYMHYISIKDDLKKTREKKVIENRKNLIKMDFEANLCVSYDKLLEDDLATFSDNEFYQLFNLGYVGSLNVDYDEKSGLRLTNLCNELIRREFKDFDISGLEIPNIEFIADYETGMFALRLIYSDETYEVEVSSAEAGVSTVIKAMSYIAQSYNLFTFKDKQEEEQCKKAKEWISLKQNKFSEKDADILNSEYNILVIKSMEFLTNLQSKINHAIEKSNFVPHVFNNYINDDMNCHYDYIDFINCGSSKEENINKINKYIEEDIKKMTSGGRK